MRLHSWELFLYADDLILMSESASELQKQLDALAMH